MRSISELLTFRATRPWAKRALLVGGLAAGFSASHSRAAFADVATPAASAKAALEPGVITGGRRGLSKWPIDHSDPERSVPTQAQREKNPLEFGYHLMDLIEAAEQKAKAG